MKQTVKRIVETECCNHFADGPYGAYHWCVNRDAVCPIFTEFRRCKWFEEAVLPAWPDVAAEYADMCGQEETGEITIIRQAKCRNCGDMFKTESNSERYCSGACRDAVARQVQRDKKRRQRAGVK
jgi:hypothetical protein